jgi:O-antigen/teichoic acid export membrane protein
MAGALSVAVRGVASSSVWLMTRHVQIRKLAVLNLTSEVVGLIVSVTWAYISPTAWALVAGRLATSVAYTVGSHLVAETRFSLQWEKEAARDILIFGTGIFLSTATYFLGGEAERLVIAKFISVAELGCFSLALTISAAPSRALHQVVGQVFFPMISDSVRKDSARAARHYGSARWAFLFMSIVLGVGFIAYSHRLVTMMLPPKFEMTGWMLQLLGFRAAQEVFAAPASSLILACGNSRFAALANTGRLILMIFGVWLAFEKFGIHQGIAVLAFVPAITYFVLIPGIAKHLRQALAVELVGVVLFLLAMALAAILPWPWA